MTIIPVKVKDDFLYELQWRKIWFKKYWSWGKYKHAIMCIFTGR